jgi:hypothetical protein
MDTMGEHYKIWGGGARAIFQNANAGFLSAAKLGILTVIEGNWNYFCST